MKRILTAIGFILTAASAQAEVEIQQLTTDAGIDVWLVEEHSIPFVAVEMLFEGGTSLDVDGKRGATNLMMALIEEGSGDMDARTFQRERESLAASFGFSAYDDSVSVSAKFLTENSDQAVALLAQALNDPRFDQDAIDRVRAQVLTNIASDEKNPNRIAGNAFYAAAFGDHPYGSNSDGTIESVNALTQEDLFEAHQNAFALSRLSVSVVGDITPDEVGPMIDSLVAGLSADGPALPDRVEFGLPGGVTVIPYDTPQSVALFGQAGIKRDDEDFFAAFILNTILGGNGPQSILMEEVREKRGLTYGIGSYLVPKDHAEMWLGSVASANEVMAETIDVVTDQWARVATVGVSQEELDAAKTYLTGEYPLRFDSNQAIADIMVGMQVEGLPVEYILNRNDYINAVTLDDVNRVAREILDPDALHFVVVGQPEGLETSE
ncbi:peptidase M16 [Marivivens niveibacter]|uniref:Peptidase M16 n=1 Tax=Marivivens niveibacter TaxID=1930667 RepID=A0A251WYF1_9RHOB|nr:pitrilysin family protein [Marivivens niveibacter]OUD09509.1 peptidase M16 [Marivivens niveibacter]